MTSSGQVLSALDDWCISCKCLAQSQFVLLQNVVFAVELLKTHRPPWQKGRGSTRSCWRGLKRCQPKEGRRMTSSLVSGPNWTASRRPDKGKRASWTNSMENWRRKDRSSRNSELQAASKALGAASQLAKERKAKLERERSAFQEKAGL